MDKIHIAEATTKSKMGSSASRNPNLLANESLDSDISLHKFRESLKGQFSETDGLNFTENHILLGVRGLRPRGSLFCTTGFY